MGLALFHLGLAGIVEAVCDLLLTPVGPSYVPEVSFKNQ